MNKYHVILNETVTSEEQNLYEVLAETEEEAIEEVLCGNAKLINSNVLYSDIETSNLEDCTLIQKMV